MTMGTLYFTAVGGCPSMANILGIDHVYSDATLFDLPSKPEKIAIVGRGYISWSSLAFTPAQ
jgi:pyruvate/2-oxoglutarate dehydrogenase complex dihydrolipoamide dehydrogenase (E3) component